MTSKNPIDDIMWMMIQRKIQLHVTRLIPYLSPLLFFSMRISVLVPTYQYKSHKKEKGWRYDRVLWHDPATKRISIFRKENDILRIVSLLNAILSSQHSESVRRRKIIFSEIEIFHLLLTVKYLKILSASLVEVLWSIYRLN